MPPKQKKEKLDKRAAALRENLKKRKQARKSPSVPAKEKDKGTV